MPWLSVHSVYHPILFSPDSTKHSQPCSVLESFLAILNYYLNYACGFCMTKEQGIVGEQQQLKQKKPSSSSHFSLLNCKLESNLGDLFCFPP